MKAFFALLLLAPACAGASDLKLHLRGEGAFTREAVRMQCDAAGSTLGLPTVAFTVVYRNGRGTSLAILPLNGIDTIFVNVEAASGARYRARQFTWWQSHGKATFDSAIGDKTVVNCRPLP